MSISPYFPSRRENLNRLLNFKEKFDVFVASQISNDSYLHIWDIPISGDDFWLMSCTSPKNGPLSGLARYLNWFQFEEPVLGTCNEKIPEMLRQRERTRCCRRRYNRRLIFHTLLEAHHRNRSQRGSPSLRVE